MPTIYDCDPGLLTEKASEELKKVDKIKAPEWAAYAKTGMHKERPPANGDWWHARAASVLRQIYRYGPIGVSKLRTRYGGKKNRGFKTEHFYKGSGNILRKVMQQLEEAGFIKKEDKGVHKGRVITAEGKKFLDGVASKISVAVPDIKPKPKKQEAKAEEKPKAEEKEEMKSGPKRESKKEAKPETQKEKKEQKPVEKEIKENKETKEQK